MSPQTSILKKLSREAKSCAPFCIGVPVKHHRYVAFRQFTAFSPLLFGFLTWWASSRMMRWKTQSSWNIGNRCIISGVGIAPCSCAFAIREYSAVIVP